MNTYASPLLGGLTSIPSSFFPLGSCRPGLCTCRVRHLNFSLKSKLHALHACVPEEARRCRCCAPRVCLSPPSFVRPSHGSLWGEGGRGLGRAAHCTECANPVAPELSQGTNLRFSWAAERGFVALCAAEECKLTDHDLEEEVGGGCRTKKGGKMSFGLTSGIQVSTKRAYIQMTNGKQKQAEKTFAREKVTGRAKTKPRTCGVQYCCVPCRRTLPLLLGAPARFSGPHPPKIALCSQSLPPSAATLCKAR
jgi:hypothetical protein|mmetsp:Transcript_47868/g.77913  ORF Transcript_47868/g.77913 Transcript_47868/m.77913 type:complete len:251 (+) Transcript_47868:1588-2340(+)